MIHVYGTVYGRYNTRPGKKNTEPVIRALSLWSWITGCPGQSQLFETKGGLHFKDCEIGVPNTTSPPNMVFLQSSHLSKWQLWLWGCSCQNSWGYSWLLSSSHTSITNPSAIQLFLTLKINANATLSYHYTLVQFNKMPSDWFLLFLPPPTLQSVFNTATGMIFLKHQQLLCSRSDPAPAAFLVPSMP